MACEWCSPLANRMGNVHHKPDPFQRHRMAGERVASPGCKEAALRYHKLHHAKLRLMHALAAERKGMLRSEASDSRRECPSVRRSSRPRRLAPGAGEFAEIDRRRSSDVWRPLRSRCTPKRDCLRTYSAAVPTGAVEAHLISVPFPDPGNTLPQVDPLPTHLTS
ncbi:hypothetical protein DIPPA_19710 [Diplonema papillatum]|nr:hypothetical protein DIPPA_19710 [Diplonema papillatum]